MWAVVVLTLHAFSGIQGHTVSDLGVFKTEAGCKAGLDAAFPGFFKPGELRGYDAGYVRFACVRIQDSDVFLQAK